MQYYCAIHKIIRVFLGKTESTRRQWNSYGEQFEAGVLTSQFSAVSWRVCAQPPLAMAVEALVGVWVMLNGHWATGGMDQWTPVLWGRTWEPENREGSGLQTSFLSTSSHSAGLLSQEQREVEEDCGRRYQFNWEGDYQVSWRQDNSLIHSWQDVSFQRLIFF